MSFCISPEFFSPLSPSLESNIAWILFLAECVLIYGPVDHIFYDAGFIVLARDTFVRKESVLLAAARIGALSHFDLQPFFLAADLFIDPFDPAFLLKPASADRTCRIFIAPD